PGAQSRRLRLSLSRRRRDLQRQCVRAPLSRYAYRDGAGPGASVQFRRRRPGAVRHRAEPAAIAMAESESKTLRKEDPALLSGRGRYADDLPVPVGTLHAHVVRSPHAHADIVAIDAAAALAHDGVWAVITGEDIRKLSEPFLAAVKTPVQQWALAVERVRYVGEPVALVVAESRYIAEDAAELVTVEYAALEAIIDPRAACEKTAPLIHPQAETN